MQLDRLLLVLDDRSLIKRFSRVFLHQKVYRISDFLVRMNHNPAETKYHLTLTHSSVVESCDAAMPEHCWDLVTVPYVITGLADNGGLIGKWHKNCFYFVIFF